MKATTRRIAVSGAGGFLGSALVRNLRGAGWDVHPLVRRDARHGEISWDPDAGRIDRHALEEYDAVIHLAGESISGLWTTARKRRIFDSRARGTTLIAETIARSENGPRILISASGVGYYGDSGDAVLTESSPPGDDFLARVCLAWEAATAPAKEAGVRVVNTRLGMVIHPSGGALKLMLPAFRLGIGGKLGNGQQWLSWIAREDAVRIFRFVLDNETITGPVNATSPEPVRNERFTEVLGRTVRRPTFLSVPAPILRAVSGGMADAILLASQRAIPEILRQAGFHFELPEIGHALRPLDGSTES